MSFQDDAVEPLAIESAEHFNELIVRFSETREERYPAPIDAGGKRLERARALPRELGH